MRFNKAICISICFLSFIIKDVSAQKIVVSSFNLRYDNPGDIGNLWKDRVSPIAELIKFHDFDIVGTQEGLDHQLGDLLKLLPAYMYYGIGRDDGKKDGEYSAVFYKKDKYSLIGSGNFWLSETPEKPAVGWDANQTRICTWVKLKDKKSGKQFYVFNAHYDHMGVLARVESSKLVLKKIREIAGTAPAIFTGDLNGDRESEWYNYLKNSELLEDSFSNASHVYALNGSFNSFSPTGLNSNRVIDHIFVTSHFNATTWAILTDTYNGKYPSDHFPVVSQLVFTNQKK
jgi:endonuclease/exonuclease/phosphatase family metal-dependent hydrolase